MIRISICFWALLSICTPPSGWSQDSVVFNCYDLDSIAWEYHINNCASPIIDSLQIFINQDQNSEFTLLYSTNDATVQGYRHDSFKTYNAVFLKYFVRCPEFHTLTSDTLSLSEMRNAVELNSVRILENGNIQLTWKKKPIEGIRYVVNAAIKGSSHVIATNLTGDSYTDTRGLAGSQIEYYSISASSDCGYTFPEPDSFYHTSLLTYDFPPCGGQINFEFTPFSYWIGGTSNTALIVFKDGIFEDSIPLISVQNGFSYSKMTNNADYLFYVKETGNDASVQVSYSNPIAIRTDFYEPIKWIVIESLTLDENNQATLSWTTNDHTPDFPFQLRKNLSSNEIPPTDITVNHSDRSYTYSLPDLMLDDDMYDIILEDSCGNSVSSLPKSLLLTQGNLNGGFELNIHWSDITDKEWTPDNYDIYYKTDGLYSLLGSVNGTSFNFQNIFDENNPLDSLCYYIVANGEVYFEEADSTAPLNIRSNTVCLYGETTVNLPNAYRTGTEPYLPVIAPLSNISSYSFRVFDRFGNLVFETHNPIEGWNGTHQDSNGFNDVYVVTVELENTQGEQIHKSGSVLLFP